MGKYIDLTGKKFYDLTVIKRCGSNRYGALWECKCECGNTVIVRSAELNNGSKKSCGCTKFFDRDYNVTGQKFGRLLVIDDAEPLVDKNGRNRMVLCRCDCGNFVIKKMTKVVNGERHTMKEWAEIYGIPYYLVKDRVSRGYDIEKALTPVTDRKQKVRVKETGMVYESQSACARDMGINQWNISRCLLGRATEVNGYHFERVVE